MRARIGTVQALDDSRSYSFRYRASVIAVILTPLPTCMMYPVLYLQLELQLTLTLILYTALRYRIMLKRVGQGPANGYFTKE